MLSDTTTDLRITVPWWLRFRWHVLPAPLIWLAMQSQPLELLGFLEHPSILLFAVEFGTWQFPLNFLFTVCVFPTMVCMSLINANSESPRKNFRAIQILLWWYYWISFGLALRFGEYHGP